MQDEVVFPAFGIDCKSFWRRCTDLVREGGYDSELAYMKVLLDTLDMDRPTNAELKSLGTKLNFYKGLPEMFEQFREGLLTTEQVAHGIKVEHYIISSGMKVLIEGSRLAPYVRAIFGCEFAEDEQGRITFPKRVISHTQKTQYLFRINKGMLDMSQDVNDHMDPEIRVKHIAPSDYRPNTHLRMLLEQMVQEIADRMVAERRSATETGTVRAPKH